MGARALNLSRLYRSIVFGTAGLAVLGASAAARAAPPASKVASEKPWAAVRIQAPECETSAFRAKAFLHLLDVELLAERLRIAKNDTAPQTIELTVTIDATICDAASRDLSIRLQRADTESEIKRFLDLGDVALSARPRALALAVAEQIRQTRATPDTAVKPALPGPDEPSSFRPSGALLDQNVPANEPVPRSDPPRLGTELAASGAWRVFVGDPNTSLVGARLALSFPLASTWLRAQTSIAGLFANVANQLGNANLSYFSAGFGVLATTRGNPALLFGPHVEIGGAIVTSRAEQNPVTPRDGGQPIVLGSLVAGTRASIDAHWAAVLELETGVAAFGLTVLADERTMGALRGGFATACAGIAFAY